MDWIKRNLFFLIGGLVAVLLLGGAGFYLYKNYSDRTVNKQKLDESYSQLEQLTGMNPGPGDGKKVDNIVAAKQYQTNLVNFIGQSGRYFEPIAAIPDSTNVAAAEFAAALRNTIGQMQRNATNASVQLPPDFEFSFRAIKQLISFQNANQTLPALSVQLGEVKAIGEVLFKAKINSLESLRRERVSPDDTDPADNIDDHSVTNEIAVISPYEITFRCFSTELAAVLSGFQASPHCFIVKSVSVASGETGTSTAPGGMPSQSPSPSPFSPPGSQYPPQNRGGMQRRGGEDHYMFEVLTQTVLDEQPLRVTVIVDLVKPINSAK